MILPPVKIGHTARIEEVNTSFSAMVETILLEEAEVLQVRYYLYSQQSDCHLE